MTITLERHCPHGFLRSKYRCAVCDTREVKPAIVRAQKQQRACTRCRAPGHDRRTCENLTP